MNSSEIIVNSVSSLLSPLIYLIWLSSVLVKYNAECQQTRDHYTLVMLLIEAYLKSVCIMYTQQKAIRVKRACEKQRLSRLASSFSPNVMTSFTLNGDSTDASPPFARPENVRRESEAKRGRSNSIYPEHNEYENIQKTEEKMSVEELQILDAENVQLFNELNAMSDEVKVLGMKVVEIARLQEIFTDKVLQQEQDLNHLSGTVVAATENIRDGNDQLREAMKKSAGFRVWVLFFIITLAFTVLFLDWYNP